METINPSLPETVSIYICRPGLIINITSLDSQNCSDLKDKLYAFPRYRAQRREKSLGCPLGSGLDSPDLHGSSY